MNSAAEVPKAPDDPELRNIIDKLAQFVAKNGSEFEQMTKQKQKDNPKFQFLFGGEHYHYYQYKVTGEQALQKKAKQAGDPATGPTAQIALLEKQLADSERNLKAQWEALSAQSSKEIDAAIHNQEKIKVNGLASGANLVLDDFAHVLEALAVSCTKEAISKGKHWIFTNCQTDVHREIVLIYLLQRVKDRSVAGNFGLHILYLINDWAHHCFRKGQESIMKLVEKYVAAMYSYAMERAVDEPSGDGKDKLEKLKTLWSSQNYFGEDTFKQMENYKDTLSMLKKASASEYANVSAEINQRTTTTYNQYEQQHNEFSRHVNQQLTALRTAQQIANSIQQTAPAPPVKRRSRFDQATPGSAATGRGTPPQFGAPRPPYNAGPPMPPVPPVPPMYPEGPNMPHVWNGPPGPSGPYGAPPGPPYQNQGFPPRGGGSQGPRSWGPRGPGPWGPGNPRMMHVPRPAKDDPNLIPTVAYYDLPAGLMVPLVSLEDYSYKALDSRKIRLPPAMPPSERLLAAMESFYSPPSYDSPRDSEGWERQGLYEYYNEKRRAANGGGRRREEEERYSPSRRDDTPSPTRRRRSRTRSPSRSPRRRSPSGSRSPSPTPSPSRSRSASRSRSRSDSDSPPGFTSAPRVFPEKTELGKGNKGHDLMLKMGWSEGSGLGSQEQGRTSPVSGGEVRDRADQFKGIGAKGPDPFEAFRRQKSGHYVQRIKQAHKSREGEKPERNEDKEEEYDY